MDKIKKVVKLEDLPKDGIKALMKKFPDGIEDQVRKITKPSGDFFYAVDVDTKTVSYLVKIDVEVDFNSEEDKIDLDFLDERAEREAQNHSKSEGGTPDDEEEDS